MMPLQGKSAGAVGEEPLQSDVTVKAERANSGKRHRKHHLQAAGQAGAMTTHSVGGEDSGTGTRRSLKARKPSQLGTDATRDSINRKREQLLNSAVNPGALASGDGDVAPFSEVGFARIEMRRADPNRKAFLANCQESQRSHGIGGTLRNGRVPLAKKVPRFPWCGQKKRVTLPPKGHLVGLFNLLPSMEDELAHVGLTETDMRKLYNCFQSVSVENNTYITRTDLFAKLGLPDAKCIYFHR